MTPDERTLLTNFLSDLMASRGVVKDREADALIGQALAANPDAAYLLVQHAIVADQALHSAQARIADLEARVAPTTTSFLPPASPWSGRPQAASPWGGQSGYAQPAYGQPAYAPAAPDARPSIFGGGGGLGSFLRSAGTTAAGVAGGEMLFDGLSNLFGGHHAHGLFGGDSYDAPRENIVINNYGDGDDDGSDGGDDS